MLDSGVHRAGLGKQMRSVRNDFKCLRPAKAGERIFVELDDASIGASHDQQSWRPNKGEGLASQIRTSAARDHGANSIRQLGCRDEGGRSSGTGDEQCDRKVSDRRSPA